MESMKRVVHATVFVFVAGVTGLFWGQFSQASVAISTDSPGPLKTSSAVYKFAPAVDADVLPHVTTEIWARVYWPAPMKDPSGKKRPLLMFLHGNHGTCGSGTGPRNDSSCQYTNEGACPAGYVVTPNHEGYNYAAEHLASWGYVVVSINANRGITCGGGNSDDWGLILARGRLVLKHLEHWNKWATVGGAPKELGTADLFKDLVDLKQVGLMGHSRGGEGVRAALNLYRDQGSIWPAKIPDLDIKAIYEIGAVDGQSDRVLDAPAVAWNQLLPLCDGDVNDLQGRMPFERMSSRYFTKNEAESRPSSKSLSQWSLPSRTFLPVPRWSTNQKRLRRTSPRFLVRNQHRLRKWSPRWPGMILTEWTRGSMNQRLQVRVRSRAPKVLLRLCFQHRSSPTMFCSVLPRMAGVRIPHLPTSR